jgi:ribulose-5-phosphate 4-epimerase/fuculose-1-phosphate aldolase
MLYAMFAGMAWISRKLMRGRYERATIGNIVVDATGAATIPVLATFTGVSGLPWWYGIATNNAKPLFVIERNGIRFRVIRAQSRRFSDIACVDVRQAAGTVNLEIAFHEALLTFSANLGAVPLASHVLRLFPPTVALSARAAAIRDMRA